MNISNKILIKLLNKYVYLVYSCRFKKNSMQGLVFVLLLTAIPHPLLSGMRERLQW